MAEGEPRRTKRRVLRGLLILLGLAVLVIAMAWWKMIHMPGKSHRGELPAADEHLVALAGELKAAVVHLAAEIGERNVLDFPAALQESADWIKAEFRAAGYEVRRQTYPVSGVECSNLEVEIAGAAQREEIVIVAAHYDSVPGTPGANDNASGVAALLALARRFADEKPDRTLRFVALVNEEPPNFQTEAMGAWVYARSCRERDERIVAMLSLETIGYYSDAPASQHYPPPFGLLYPSVGNFIAFVGNTGSADLVREVVRVFRENEPFPSEGGALPEFIPGIGFSDQWGFWQQGYPGLMATDTAMFRYPHYHEPSDTPDKIDFDRMARVVRGLERVISHLIRLKTNSNAALPSS